MADQLDLRALGPLEVRVGGELGPQPSPLRMRLLAALLARAGRPLAIDELTEVLWGDAPPPTAAASIQVHVHRLRRHLGDAGHLAHGPAGYQITVTAGEYDAARFSALTARAGRERQDGRTQAALDTVRRALDLWRGEPFGGIVHSGLVAAAAERLTQERLAADTSAHELGLDLGRHAELLGPLAKASRERPYDEHLAALLMLALHRCGKRDDALAVYRAKHAQLIEDLGVEPGESLRRMHEAVRDDDARLADLATESLDGAWEALRQSATVAEVPRELPRPPHPFAGRGDELRALDELVERPGQGRTAVVTGIGGVGKTALAVHWAHRAADRFPDGQLYIDLRGHGDTPPLRPIDALATMLPSLGVPPAQVPLDPGEAAARLRERTADRRLLVVLDNAASADQVRPLLPEGPNALVVVTSRRRLDGLVTEPGGVALTLGPLASGDARDLVARLLRVPDQDAGDLAERCGRLPLALRIAAANLAESPNPDVGAYIRRLSRTDRLDSLRIDDDADDAAVRAVFASSYRAMPESARRLFRLLGSIPGTDISAEGSASLSGASLDATERALGELVEAHLVDHHRPGRYRLHDLISLYAAEQLTAEDPEPERFAASERLLLWYLHGADECRARVYPSFYHIPLSKQDNVLPEMDRETASVWLKTEHRNLIAAVVYAAEHGPQRIAWQLNDLLRGYIWLSAHGPDGLRAGRAALAAAEAENDLAGQAVTELGLTTAMLRCNRPEEAIEHGLRAVELGAAAGFPGCQAAAEQNIAHACASLGRLREAIAHGEAALRIAVELDGYDGEVANLAIIGVAYCHLGELDTSIEYFTRGLDLAVERNMFTFEGSLRANLANAHRLHGDVDIAQSYMDEVLKTQGGVSQSVTVLTLAARIHLAAGRHEQALDHATRAVDGLDGISDQRIGLNALSALGSVKDAIGEHRAAVDCFDRALDLAVTDALYYRTEATCARAAALLHLGEHEAAEADAHAALELARTSEFGLLIRLAQSLLAAIAAARHS
ncbi:BTAD domain-containing putative transcriptional regulator [Glycomyces sp. NPDC046736]|uniref:AfsR/SARP family transcriptional regulator n=1 Tax=Glycomyces sp. NPDC046736 TaxID=3155615 RepID=UPI0033F3743B